MDDPSEVDESRRRKTERGVEAVTGSACRSYHHQSNHDIVM